MISKSNHFAVTNLFAWLTMINWSSSDTHLTIHHCSSSLWFRTLNLFQSSMLCSGKQENIWYRLSKRDKQRYCLNVLNPICIAHTVDVFNSFFPRRVVAQKIFQLEVGFEEEEEAGVTPNPSPIVGLKGCLGKNPSLTFVPPNPSVGIERPVSIVGISCRGTPRPHLLSVSGSSQLPTEASKLQQKAEEIRASIPTAQDLANLDPAEVSLYALLFFSSTPPCGVAN